VISPNERQAAVSPSPTRGHVLVGLIVFSIPLSCYAAARALGWLPSETDWWAQRMSHGPWRWEWPMLLVLSAVYGLPILGLIAFVREVRFAFRMRRPIRVLGAIGVAVLFLALSVIQASLLFWTID
jgi:hypothetical protein